jgi:hypothetical protein
MKRVIASIQLKRTEDGGRNTPILGPIYHAAAFFNDVPALREFGRDCRMLVAEYGQPIPPGGSVDEIALLFLYPDDVLPHLGPGVKFELWEGRIIGNGTVLRLEDAT